MSIIRTERTGEFTVIPNELINDACLDGESLGLLVFLLSKPADWWVKIQAIESLRRFGSHGKVVKTLHTLRTLGYAKLIRMSTGHTEWIITDTRSELQQTSHIPKSGIREQEPHSEKPHSEKPHSENRNVLQKKDLDKRLNKTKETPLPPKGEVQDEKVKFKPENLELPAFVTRDLWILFCKHRKEIKKPLTETACKLLILKLERFQQAGHNVPEMISDAIANGWQSVHEPKGKPAFVAPTVSRQARRVYQ